MFIVGTVDDYNEADKHVADQFGAKPSVVLYDIDELDRQLVNSGLSFDEFINSLPLSNKQEIAEKLYVE